MEAGFRGVWRLRNQQVPSYVAGDARVGWKPAAALELSLVGQSLFDPRHPEFGTTSTRREVERSLYGRATWSY